MTEPRTLVVSNFFPPEDLGGAHRWHRLVAELPDDYPCRVLCPSPAYPFGEFNQSWTPIETDEIDGVPVTRLWTYQPKSDGRADDANWGRILNYGIFSLLATIYILLNRWRYDTVITVSAPHTTFVPGIVGKLLGMTWIPDIYDLWLDNAIDLGYVDRGSVTHRFISAIERQAIRHSDCVIVITDTMANHFVKKYDVSHDRFEIVPFGVSSDLFNPDNRGDHTRTVVYTGNMGDAHALHPFLTAFNHLDPDIHLNLVGTGKRRNELEQFCEKRGLTSQVTFHGVVPREQVPHHLNNAAASIVPLKRDRQLDYARPTKLLETMASGTPYVASSLTEIDLITTESNAGIAVKNDPEQIADAISTIVKNQNKARDMGENGVKFIERHHRWPMLADRVHSLLTRL